VARPTVGRVDPLSLPSPRLTLHHDPSQDPVDSRLVTQALRLEPVDHFGIHAQRDPPLAWTVPARLYAPLLPASETRSSSTDARSSRTFSRHDLAFRCFAFLGLAIMTQSCTPDRHDDMFHVEHWDNTGEFSRLAPIAEARSAAQAPEPEEV